MVKTLSVYSFAIENVNISYITQILHCDKFCQHRSQIKN